MTHSLCVILLISCVVGLATAGTCAYDSSHLVSSLGTPNYRISYSGGGFRIQPLQENGQLYPYFWVDVNVSSLNEVVRGPTLSPGCPPPGLPNDPDDELTQIKRSVNLADCDCSHTMRTTSLRAGVSEEQLVIGYDCGVAAPEFANMTLNVVLKLPNATYTTQYEPTPTTLGYIINSTYHASLVSFSMEISDWPWHPDYINNVSYVMVEFANLASVNGRNVTIGTESNQFNSSLRIWTDASYFALVSETDYLINGRPFLPRRAGTIPFFPIQVNPGDYLPTVFIRKQFCTEIEYEYQTYTRFVKWQNMTYDPYFNSVFFGNPPTDAPISPSLKKRDHTVVAIVVPTVVVVVLILAAGAVIAFTKVPALKKLARPFTERSKAQYVGALSDGRGEGMWSAAKKPTA